jgi:serine protease Do
MKGILRIGAGGTAILMALQVATVAVATTNPPAKLKVDEAPLDRQVKSQTSFAPVIKRVSPSVVNISSTMVVKERTMRSLLGDDPMLKRFFGEGDGSEDTQPRSRRAQSLGSGVIVSPDGYILTANHVVEGAEKVRVTMGAGEKQYDAKIIGTDKPTDVAVLKIDATDLPQIVITDSDKLDVGDTVLAVGNPFDLSRTVTMGIVSAVGRGGFGINTYEDFIQTDAAINMGNSGGPLVDAQGRLVGINTVIFSASGGFQGIGFAVPANLARNVMDKLIQEGKVTRGYLGLRLQRQEEVTPELVKDFNLPDANGALVNGVEPNSPAAKAGFKEGDFVTEVNGKRVASTPQLMLVVSQTAPGSKVNIKLLREGKQKTLAATLGQLTPEQLTGGRGRGQQHDRDNTTNDALDGVEVTDLDNRARRQLRIPETVQGVLVSKVDPESNSADAGLRPGDVITEINRQTVGNAEEAITLSEKAKSPRIRLRIWRTEGGDGAMRYLVVDNAKRK